MADADTKAKERANEDALVRKAQGRGYPVEELAGCVRMGPDTTREELLSQGVTEAGADELMDYMAYLKAKEAGEFDGDYEDWRSD